MTKEQPEAVAGAATEAGAIADLIRLDPQRHDHDDDLISLVLRDSDVLQLVDLEPYRATPARKRGQVTARTPAGLVAYATRHKDDQATLWVDIARDGLGTITVIFDDHTSDEAGWADHRVTLILGPSPELIAWTSHADKDLSQQALAEFLEERLADVIEPDGATLLEVAQTLHATSGARFKSAIALHSGEQQLVWEETIDAKAGQTGQTEIPRSFAIAVRPFVGTEKTRIDGAFRFRVREGRLTLGYRLLNLDQALEAAVGEVATKVSDELGLAVIEAAAPARRSTLR